ncbi:MAG: hypothetical protein O2975_04595 [Proteobacteria bacterium]|nr:hypothetical protein [Pseudomonadota bacterium]
MEPPQFRAWPQEAGEYTPEAYPLYPHAFPNRCPDLSSIPDSARRFRHLLIAAYVVVAAACVGLPAWLTWGEHDTALETVAL